MIIIKRNGKVTALRGWRAWLALAAAFVSIALGTALLILVLLGIAITIGSLLLVAIPLALLIAVVTALSPSTTRQR
jgi:hypothetical protein